MLRTTEVLDLGEEGEEEVRKRKKSYCGFKQVVGRKGDFVSDGAAETAACDGLWCFCHDGLGLRVVGILDM